MRAEHQPMWLHRRTATQGLAGVLDEGPEPWAGQVPPKPTYRRS